jgi:hypothetical protein
MSVVSLAIVEPHDGQRFLGAEASDVRLRGRVDSSGHGSLYYKWYSGLADVLNGASDNPFDFTKPLAVGSHVLTFTAKDVPGDTLADLQVVRHAGMAGGPPPPEETDTPGELPEPSSCVVHVFVATMVEPPDHATSSTTLDRASSSLTAVAPSQWGKLIDLEDPAQGYELNPEYHGDEEAGKVPVNKIQYRWRFQPSGPPEGRPEGDLVPAKEDLTFSTHPEDDDLMVVTYNGPLAEPPTALDAGNYTLTLRVEDQDDPATGHETSLAVVLT